MLAGLVPEPTCGTAPCSKEARSGHSPSRLGHTGDTQADLHVPPWLTLDLRVPAGRCR
jgi:hypothetical protein